MTDKLKDFVSTYKPPKRDKPFFGYLKIKNKSKGWAKKKLLGIKINSNQ